MTPSQKRFCVLTTGRTGSTSLIRAIAKSDDVAVPSKNIECPDEELVHPRCIKKHLAAYARLTGGPIRDAETLIDRFFECNTDYRFAGFKTMPNRHRNYRRFVTRPDIKFVVLTRDDVASTAASFLVARRSGSWRRSGERHGTNWPFRPEDRAPVLSNLVYICQSNRMLAAVPDTIRLTYEQICGPDFHSEELDRFFGRSIRIENTRPPISGTDYISNWTEFKAFVDNGIPRVEAALSRRTQTDD